ncbi:putative importin-7 [Dorcoceras hygrometricum]|uniref:Putative importin-7 n=1 Tax=Dorcoceras hygrometricum TaxID=472368 RepID=A0A2Z7BC47_9LAMI|nr:putative importin-7 [Dorcoceras hygrometricum]
MKYEYRLLKDILAKEITVKVGSFDAVTNERFLMRTAIQFGLKVNWSKILFGVLKEMVDRTQKKAKGYAAQICALLKSNPVITFVEVVPFPTSKVLSIKTVHTYIAMNHTIDARVQSTDPGMEPVAIVKRKSKSKKTSETTGETPVEVITEVVSKKRPSVESDEPLVLKKRRMTKSKASYSKASLDILNVSQDVVPLQIVEPTPAATTEKSPLPKRTSKKRRLVLSKDSDDENVEEQESIKDTVAVSVEESTVVKHTDEVDVIIGQVLEETSKLATDESEQREQRLDEPEVGDTDFGDSPVNNADNFEQWLDESFEDFIETETVDKTEDSKEVAVEKTPEKAVGSNQTDEELMSIDDLLMHISDNMMLPSVTAAEGNDYWRSSCRLSLFVNRKQFPGSVFDANFVPHACFIEPVQYWGAAPLIIHSWGWYRVCTEVIRYSMFGCLRPVRDENLCRAIVAIGSVVDVLEKHPTNFCSVVEQGQATDDSVCYFSDSDVQSEIESTSEIDLVSSYGSTVYRSPSTQFDSFQERIDDSHNDILSRLNTLDRGHRDTMRQHEETLRNVIHNARQDNRTQGDVHILHLNEFKKWVLAHGASVTADLMEVRKEVKELDAKVNYLDGQVAAIRSELFDFQAKVAENSLNLSTQLGDLVDNLRGSDAKKGEGSSSRPQPPPDDQGSGSGGGGSGVEQQILWTDSVVV